MSEVNPDSELTLGYSPCPNDTFIFHGLVSGSVKIANIRFREQLHDVETLNAMAFSQQLDVTKLSFYAYLAVKDNYRLLSSGGALGYGCGPLVVARKKIDPGKLASCRVAVPGRWTTAHLLLQLWAPGVKWKHFTTYERVCRLVAEGEVDCGVVIHESRFTFQRQGLMELADLGAWWQDQTGLPVPLGCIAVQRRHRRSLALAIENGIRESIGMSRSDPEAVLPYIRQHAQEMDRQVLENHVRTFVNQFSIDLGDKGRAAVEALEKRAIEAGILR